MIKTFTLLVILIILGGSDANDLPSGCLNAFRATALATHNILRRRHGESTLIENSDLDKSALDYANYLAAKDIFQHSGVAGRGENLYVSYAQDDLTSSQCSCK